MSLKPLWETKHGQGYAQTKGADFDKTFTHVARLELARLLLALACHFGFKPFQMDIKITFLNGILKEQVYGKQPKGFEDH